MYPQQVLAFWLDGPDVLRTPKAFNSFPLPIYYGSKFQHLGGRSVERAQTLSLTNWVKCDLGRLISDPVLTSKTGGIFCYRLVRRIE